MYIHVCAVSQCTCVLNGKHASLVNFMYIHVCAVSHKCVTCQQHSVVHVASVILLYVHACTCILL